MRVNVRELSLDHFIAKYRPVLSQVVEQITSVKAHENCFLVTSLASLYAPAPCQLLGGPILMEDDYLAPMIVSHAWLLCCGRSIDFGFQGPVAYGLPSTTKCKSMTIAEMRQDFHPSPLHTRVIEQSRETLESVFNRDGDSIFQCKVAMDHLDRGVTISTPSGTITAEMIEQWRADWTAPAIF